MCFNMKVLFLAVCGLGCLWKLVNSECADIQKIIDKPLPDLTVNVPMKKPANIDSAIKKLDKKSIKSYRADKKAIQKLSKSKSDDQKLSVVSKLKLVWGNLCKKYDDKYIRILSIRYGGGLCYVLRPWRDFVYPYVYCRFERCDKTTPWNFRCMPDAYKYYRLWMWCPRPMPHVRPFKLKLPKDCCCKKMSFSCKDIAEKKVAPGK